MVIELMKPQNALKLLAGLSALFFERFNGAAPVANGNGVEEAAAPVQEKAVVLPKAAAPVKPAPVAPVAPVVETNLPEEDAPVAAAAPAQKEDDLTEIAGIGPTFARRLREAGITSFAMLAELTPEYVKEVAKLRDWQGDPVDWIAQAQAMV